MNHHIQNMFPKKNEPVHILRQLTNDLIGARRRNRKSTKPNETNKFTRNIAEEIIITNFRIHCIIQVAPIPKKTFQNLTSAWLETTFTHQTTSRPFISTASAKHYHLDQS